MTGTADLCPTQPGAARDIGHLLGEGRTKFRLGCELLGLLGGQSSAGQSLGSWRPALLQHQWVLTWAPGPWASAEALGGYQRTVRAAINFVQVFRAGGTSAVGPTEQWSVSLAEVL